MAHKAGWGYGGKVGDEDAKTYESGTRIEALWGGSPKPDDGPKGHIVSNDGVNASYVREPGGGEPIVDDSQPNPYGD